MQVREAQERPRLLVLDPLESCGVESRCVGKTARAAIMDALRRAGICTAE
jgi:hypothetical protein